MNETVLGILKWVAIGKEESVEEYDGDIVGYKCIFDCGYDTSLKGEEHKEHAPECLMYAARRELSEMGNPLRYYRIEYKFTYTPTPEHLEKYPFFARREDRPRNEEVYTIELLKFNMHQFILQKTAAEQERIDPEREKFIVSIDPKNIIIHTPEFF